MIKIIKIAMVGIIATSAASTLGASNAQAAGALQKTTIALIDSARIMQTSAAGKDLEKQLGQIRVNFQKEITEVQAKLKAEGEKIQKQKNTILSKEAYEAKVRAFQLKINKYDKDKQLKERQVQAALQAATMKINKALKPIYQKILKDYKATMILDTRFVIAKKPGTGMDVTTTVLELLDAKLPALKLEYPPKK